jgi:protein-tyrosine phosphatase
MIDVHCHVLPFVDYDGPQTLEDSLEMLDCALKDGINVIVATPHVMTADLSNKMEEIKEALLMLRENATNGRVGVELRLGAEVYMGPDLYEFVKSNPVLIEGPGRSVLVELPMHDVPPYAQPQLVSLASEGITPVVAHPERNLKVIRDQDILYQLSGAGVLFQVNAGSFLGAFGKDVRRTANSLVSAGLCNFVASDAHNSGNRSFSVTEARAAVEKLVGEAQANTIFEHNPNRLLGIQH